MAVHQDGAGVEVGELADPQARPEQQPYDRAVAERRRSLSRSTALSCSGVSARGGAGTISTRGTGGAGSARESSSDVAAARARLTVEGARPRSTRRRRQ
jgi:hypothetical protein